MAQAGLVGKWHRHEVSNFKMKQGAGQGREDQEGLNVDQKQMTVKPLSLDHLQVYKFCRINTPTIVPTTTNPTTITIVSKRPIHTIEKRSAGFAE